MTNIKINNKYWNEKIGLRINFDDKLKSNKWNGIKARKNYFVDNIKVL